MDCGYPLLAGGSDADNFHYCGCGHWRWVIVFMSALLAGLQANFIRRLLSTQSHIQLLQPQQVTRQLRNGADAPKGQVEGAIVQPALQQTKSIDQWQAVVEQVRAMPEVKVVSPVANGPVLAVRGNPTRAITVSGIESETYFRIVDFSDKILRGTLRMMGSDILIDSELSNDLGIDVGDKLHVTAANGATSVLSIVGVFDLGNKGAIQRNTFTVLHTAQSLLDLPGGVTSIEVTVQDIYAAEMIAQRIAAANSV
jgi:lipoprotein-releasing system permease protein